MMFLSNIINKKAIVCELKSTNVDDAVSELVETIKKVYSPKGFKSKEVVKAIMNREKQGSTAKRGIAIPHAKIDDLEGGVYIAIGKTSKGIDFVSPDGELVHTMFMIVTSQNSEDNTMYLQILARLAKLTLIDNFSSFLKQCKTSKSIYELIVEIEEKLDEH